MYRFKTSFELSADEIKHYVKIYAKRRRKPFVIALSALTCIFILGAVFFAAVRKDILFAAVSAGAAVLSVIIIAAVCAVFKKIYLKEPPFVIGPYITIELSDGFLHVNCSGNMKSYPQGRLEADIIDGDYILTTKKDMVVLPHRILTRLIVGELINFLGE